MKFSTLILISVLGISSAAYACGDSQNKTGKCQGMGQHSGKNMGQGRHFGKGNHAGLGQKMIELLKLTPEQTTKFQEIVKASPMNKDVAGQDMDKVRAERHQKILAILTPEQKKIFEDHIKSRGFSVK